MPTVYNFRVYCTTDNKYVTTWEEVEPTKCPENTDHDINQAITTIIDKISSDEITIKEEYVPTGGHFKIDMFKIVAPANQIAMFDFSFPYPINVITARLVTGPEHKGDVLCWAVSPNTTIGALMGPITVYPEWVEGTTYNVNDIVFKMIPERNYGKNYKCKISNNNVTPETKTHWSEVKTTIAVSSTVTGNIKVGFFVDLFDGPHNENIGYVIGIDKVNGTITLDGAVKYSFSPMSPTYIRMSIMFMDHVEIGPPMNYPVGGDKIGSSYVPANTIVRSAYNNKSNQDKVLIAYMEYLY